MTDATDSMILLTFFLLVAVFLFSSLIWYVERGSFDDDLKCFVRKPMEDECSPFQSVPSSFYWAMATMTTVGYGDDVAITPVGKFVTCLAMMAGVLTIGMPVSVLGARFEARYTEEQEKLRLEKLAHVQRQAREAGDPPP